MLTSSKPSRQRKWNYSKPLHQLRKEFSMHLSPDLRKALGKRSLEARVGDTVKVMRGNESYLNKQGKITALRTSKLQVLIEGITKKKGDGSEIQVPFRPSNLMLVAIDDKDKLRLNKRKKVKKDGE